MYLMLAFPIRSSAPILNHTYGNRHLCKLGFPLPATENPYGTWVHPNSVEGIDHL